MKSNKVWGTLMVRACSELREALAKVSSSTKTAFLRSSFWSDSRFEAISVRLVMAPLHLSLPFPLSSIAISDFSLSLCALKKKSYLTTLSFLGFPWFLPMGRFWIYLPTRLGTISFFVKPVWKNAILGLTEYFKKKHFFIIYIYNFTYHLRWSLAIKFVRYEFWQIYRWITFSSSSSSYVSQACKISKKINSYVINKLFKLQVFVV